jgi:hypothetical protein
MIPRMPDRKNRFNPVLVAGIDEQNRRPSVIVVAIYNTF